MRFAAGLDVALLQVFLASLLRRRLATLLSLLAIALGVALGLAVQLIHGAALDEFGRGIRLLSGEADLQVVGPRSGFAEQVYVELATHPDIADASPVLEVEARLPGRDEVLRIVGVDVFRVGAVAPVLLPVTDEHWHGDDPDRRRMAALQGDTLFLSAAARARLGIAAGQSLRVQAGIRERTLEVAGAVPGAGPGEVLGVMDVAAVQQIFDRHGVLSRVDLRLRAGVDVQRVRSELGASLPPGVEVVAPEIAQTQAAGLSRAYRVNLTMLAAIALLTGGFLVFSTQLLSVVRRRQEFALLRAIGLDRHALVRGLLAEGAVLGLLGGIAGVALAYALSAMAFRVIGGDLGAGYFRGVVPELVFAPLASLVYLALGVAAGVTGAALPAVEAARMDTARALHAGDEVRVFRTRTRIWPALACAVVAALLCTLPPYGGIPLAGYAAVLLLLAAAVLLLPAAVGGLTRLSSGRGALLMRLAHARLAALPGQAVVAGAGVVASVALASAMAIMVSSFRDSVDAWLADVLPADVYVRASSSSATGFLDPDAVARVAATSGVAAVQPIRYDSVRMRGALTPMTLVARPVREGSSVPLVTGGVGTATPTTPVWLSEAAADLLGHNVGDALLVPLAGRDTVFTVAGVWRDYARQHGALLIELDDYRAVAGDTRINDLALTLMPGAEREVVMSHVRTLFGEDLVELSLPAEIRAISLDIFDRTFLITYLMEAVAVLIGLFGVSTTFAALAASRRKEFGMLRHLGVLRSQIGVLLALEGGMTALAGVVAGLLGGGAIAVVLIEVVNRQSFHWSMDISVPWGMLAAFAAVLVVLAALAARLAGAQAMRQSTVVAVREDW